MQKKFGTFMLFEYLMEEVWQLPKGLIVSTDLDGFSLVKHG